MAAKQPRRIRAYGLNHGNRKQIVLLDEDNDSYLTNEHGYVLFFGSADEVKEWVATSSDLKESDLEVALSDDVLLNHQIDLNGFDGLVSKFEDYLMCSERDKYLKSNGLALDMEEVRALGSGLPFYIRFAHSYNIVSLTKLEEGPYHIPGTDSGSASRLQLVLYKDAQERVISLKITGNPPLTLKHPEVQAYVSFIKLMKDSVKPYETIMRR